MSDPLIADIVIGDMHIGHKTAILYPYDLEDYMPNIGQRWLYKDVWLGKLLPEVKAILKQHKPKYVHGLLGGDMGDIDLKKRSEQYWTKDINIIRDNANTLLDPFMELCDTVHVLKGTKAHTGQNSQVDEAIARNFDNVEKRNDAYYAWYKVDYRLGGVLVNAQHYGKNKSKWGEGNLVNALRDEIILERTKHSRSVPTVCYRFHFHWSYITSRYKKPIIAQVPGWQLPYDHIAQIDPVGRITEVGGLVSLYKGKEVVDMFPLNYYYPEVTCVLKK